MFNFIQKGDFEGDDAVLYWINLPAETVLPLLLTDADGQNKYLHLELDVHVVRPGVRQTMVVLPVGQYQLSMDIRGNTTAYVDVQSNNGQSDSQFLNAQIKNLDSNVWRTETFNFNVDRFTLGYPAILRILISQSAPNGSVLELDNISIVKI
ncbi:hypothetical protein ACR9HU_23765 (plasmid) [Enterobacter ludwigii]|jgi:hypothetical protein